MSNISVELDISERTELEVLRKRSRLSWEERQALALAEAIYTGLSSGLAGAGGEKVVIINHLDIQVNYGSGGGVYMTISNNKGPGSAESATTNTTNL